METRDIASRIARVVAQRGFADNPQVVDDGRKCSVFFSHPQVSNELGYVVVENPKKIWVSEPAGIVLHQSEEHAIAALRRLKSPRAVRERRDQNPEIAERLHSLTSELRLDHIWGARAADNDVWLVMFNHPRVTADTLRIQHPRRIDLLASSRSKPEQSFDSEAKAAEYLRTLTLTPEEWYERELRHTEKAAEAAAVAAWEAQLRGPSAPEWAEIRKIVKRAAPMFCEWAWVEDRFHAGSDEFLLGLISRRAKHLLAAHHALCDAGYAVRLDRTHYTASWTGTAGGLGDVLVFEDLRPPDSIDFRSIIG